jgi:uncharacterized protein YecE (DUF72 family)
MSLYVGTSGWQYADWRGGLYPAKLPQRRWLEHYAATFNTVEVNATFYRLPSVDAVQRWADTLPAGFVMTVKASRYLTHIKRLRDPAEPVSRLLGRIAPLRERGLLGPILLQLPPNFAAVPGDLAATLAEFPPDLRLAVEPRDRSWFTPTVRRILEDHAAALVWADREAKAVTPLWQTCDWLYLRFHHGRRAWSYDDSDLRRWVRRFRDAADGYVYFNNDPGGAAVRDGLRFNELLDAAQARHRKTASTAG